MKKTGPVDTVLIPRFVTQYGSPPSAANDTQRFFNEYRRALKFASEETLNRAVDRIIDAQEGRFWPTVGEVVAAVKAVVAEMVAEERNRKPPTHEEYARPDPQTRARVDLMVKDTLAAIKAKSPPAANLPTPKATDRNAWEKRFGRFEDYPEEGQRMRDLR